MRPEDRKRESNSAVLTNASNIGRALMATNSYRTLAFAWAIVGFFPVVFLTTSTVFNHEADSMTGQLQASNLVAPDLSKETCSYLTESVASRLVGVNSRHYLQEQGPYLMTFDLQPYQCGFDSAQSTNVHHCEMATDEKLPTGFENNCQAWLTYAGSGQSTADLANASGIWKCSIVEYSQSKKENI